MRFLTEHPEIIRQMTPRQQLQLKHDWLVWARDSQLEENITNTVWQHLVALAGRGWGKTRFGAEWVRRQMVSGNMRRMALVARTPEEARKVMIEGESGILEVCHPSERPIYQPANKKLIWPNGGICNVFSGEKPDGLRGHQCDGYWADEIAAWRFVQETWDMLLMGFRLDSRDGRPRGVITTTPRPIPLLIELVKKAVDAGNTGKVYLLKGRTRDNLANLNGVMRDTLLSYEGTRLGRQELDAEILDDAPGALWKRDVIIYTPHNKLPNLTKIVVGVDPQKVSHVKKAGEKGEKKNCETGIIVAGRDAYGNGYVLADFSVDGKPEVWAKAVAEAYHEFHADCVVAEVNAGGDMVQAVIQGFDPSIPVEMVNATRGQTKYARAMPVSTLYERCKIFHWGQHPKLEDQMCTWDPNESESPDRIDALVWALWYLLLGELPYDDGNRHIVGLGRRVWG